MSSISAARSGVGAHSLVVVASHTGRTKETLAAIETACARAPRRSGLTRAPDSPLATSVDESFTYGSEETVWEPKQVLLANLGHALLSATGSSEDAARITEATHAPGACRAFQPGSY